MEKVDAEMTNGLLSREMRWNWKNPCHIVHCSLSQFSKVYCIEKRFNPSELIKKEAKKFAHKKYSNFLHSEKKDWPV